MLSLSFDVSLGTPELLSVVAALSAPFSLSSVSSFSPLKESELAAVGVVESSLSDAGVIGDEFLLLPMLSEVDASVKLPLSSSELSAGAESLLAALPPLSSFGDDILAELVDTAEVAEDAGTGVESVKLPLESELNADEALGVEDDGTAVESLDPSLDVSGVLVAADEGSVVPSVDDSGVLVVAEEGAEVPSLDDSGNDDDEGSVAL